MPRDSKGNYHLSTQRAMAADKSAEKPPEKPLVPEAQESPVPEPEGDEAPIQQRVMEEAEATGAAPEDLEALQQLLDRIFGAAEPGEQTLS